MLKAILRLIGINQHYKQEIARWFLICVQNKACAKYTEGLVRKYHMRNISHGKKNVFKEFGEGNMGLE